MPGQPPDIVTLTPNPALDVSTIVARLQPSTKLRCATARRDPGGGGINAARIIHRLGGRVHALFPAGGMTGAKLDELIRQEGVPTTTIGVREETREDITIFEEETGAQYRFVLPGASLASDEWNAVCHAFGQLCAGTRHAIISGSLAPGMAQDFHARAASIAKAQGTRVIVDTSGPALAAALEVGLFLVKPNLEEFLDLLALPLPAPGTTDLPGLVRLCRECILGGRSEWIALSLGHEGALLVSRNIALYAPPLEVEVRSVVGAGDSFLGALIHAFSQDKQPEHVLRGAVAAGSASVLSPGTRLGSQAAMLRLADEVRVATIAA